MYKYIHAGVGLKQEWYTLINAQRLENERLVRKANEEEKRRLWEEKMKDAAAKKAEEERYTHTYMCSYIHTLILTYTSCLYKHTYNCTYM